MRKRARRSRQRSEKNSHFRSMLYVLFLIFQIILASKAQAADIVAAGSCPTGVDFEASGYKIRSVRVESPFEYLSWFRAALKTAESRVADLADRPYLTREVRKRAEIG